MKATTALPGVTVKNVNCSSFIGTYGMLQGHLFLLDNSSSGYFLIGRPRDSIVARYDRAPFERLWRYVGEDPAFDEALFGLAFKSNLVANLSRLKSPYHSA